MKKIVPNCDFPDCTNMGSHTHHALRDISPFNESASRLPRSRQRREEPGLVQQLCELHHLTEGHHQFSASYGWPAGLGFATTPFLRGDPMVENVLANLRKRPTIPMGAGLKARRSPRPADRQTAGGVANLALYDLCERHPDHADVGATEAKLALIGKHYSASPKRGVGHAADGDQSGFFERLARCIKTSSLDARLNDVRAIGRVDRKNIGIIADTHTAMTAVVTSFINNEWNGGSTERRAHGRISFCSKYLHFHVPDAFFIYDAVIRRRLMMKDNIQYLAFCGNLLSFTEQSADADWTPRSVDMDIYGYGDPGQK